MNGYMNKCILEHPLSCRGSGLVKDVSSLFTFPYFTASGSFTGAQPCGRTSWRQITDLATWPFLLIPQTSIPRINFHSLLYPTRPRSLYLSVGSFTLFLLGSPKCPAQGMPKTDVCNQSIKMIFSKPRWMEYNLESH